MQSLEREEMLRSCNRAVTAVRSPEWEVSPPTPEVTPVTPRFVGVMG